MILTENAVSIEVDFAGRFIEIEIRDSADNLVAIAINDYLVGDRVFDWEIMSKGNDRVTRRHSFTGLTLDTHSMGQDYSKAEHVVQYLVFSYEDCETEFFT